MASSKKSGIKLSAAVLGAIDELEAATAPRGFTPEQAAAVLECQSRGLSQRKIWTLLHDHCGYSFGRTGFRAHLARLHEADTK